MDHPVSLVSRPIPTLILLLLLLAASGCAIGNRQSLSLRVSIERIGVAAPVHDNESTYSIPVEIKLENANSVALSVRESALSRALHDVKLLGLDTNMTQWEFPAVSVTCLLLDDHPKIVIPGHGFRRSIIYVFSGKPSVKPVNDRIGRLPELARPDQLSYRLIDILDASEPREARIVLTGSGKAALVNELYPTKALKVP